MFERSERALKILCGAIGVLVLYRLVLVIVHINPLYHVTIPQLPSLPSATVETANATNSSAPPAMASTNGVRQASAAQGTNHTAQVTNLVSGSSNLVGHATNAVALASNKPVFIDFKASWCKNCEAMDAAVFTQEAVRRELSDFVVVQYEAERPNEPPAREMLDRFGILGLPSYVVLAAQK